MPSKSPSHTLSEPSSTPTIRKRKKKEDPLIATETDPDTDFGQPAKKPKLRSHGNSDIRSNSAAEPKPEKKKKTKSETNPASEVVKVKETPKENKRGDKKRKKKQAADSPVSNTEGGDEVDEQGQSSFASEEGGSKYTPPVHESLAGASRPNFASSSKNSKKYAPPEETSEQRDSRTIFVGNVPFQVMTTKVG